MGQSMKNIIFLVLAILITSISSVAYAVEYPSPDECKKLEQEIRDYIVAQSHCEKDTDCAFVGQVCPFGCLNYVHKDSINEVHKKMQNFAEKTCNRCEYDCPTNLGVVCSNNKCVSKNMLDR